MSCKCFDLLCTKIKSNVGEGTFKSEAYLCELHTTLAPPNSTAESRMRSLAKGHLMSSGAFISGKVKLAITLRMLAGGGPI
jgi:hypothetical protein